MDSKGYAIYIPGRDQLLISSNATFHQKEFPFIEGAVQWNDKTRQGEWATGFQEPRHVLDSVISESNTYNKFQQQTGGNKDFTWQTNLDSPSLVPLSTLVDPNDEPLTQHQRQSPHKNLSYKTSGSTKGHVQAIRPSSAEIRIWANDNITCEFLQENPKRDNSKSALRYDTYKHCLSISQFLEEFPNLISDFINDYSKGYIKCDKIAAVHFAHAIPTSFPVYTPKLQLDSVQGPCVLESGGAHWVTETYFDKAHSMLSTCNSLSPFRLITSPLLKLHGITIHAANYFTGLDGIDTWASISKQANLHTQHHGSPGQSKWPTLCYVDLLRPFSDSHLPERNGYCDPHVDFSKLESSSHLCFQNSTSHDPQFHSDDDIFVLYSNGSEQELTSMNDMLTGVKTPWTITEAMNSPQKADWLKSLVVEMNALRQHGTYTLVDRASLPRGTKTVSSKIVWKLKLDKEGKPLK